jgi:hypothetical protein
VLRRLRAVRELFEDIFGRNIQIVKKQVNFELQRKKTIREDPETEKKRW